MPLQVSYHDIPTPLWLFPVGSETGWRLFDIECGRGLLFELREGISLEKGRLYVVENAWSAKGAQEFPSGTLVIDRTILEKAFSDANLVYVGGSLDGQIIVFEGR